MAVPDGTRVTVTTETSTSNVGDNAPNQHVFSIKGVDTINVVVQKRDRTNSLLTDHIRKAIDDAIESFEP